MPGTRNPSIRRNNTQFQRRPIMRAAGMHGVDVAVEFKDEHFPVLNAFNLAFDFLHRRDFREGGYAFQLVFLAGRHVGELAGGEDVSRRGVGGGFDV